MDSISREYYQWIQILAYYLQSDIWPFKPNEIKKQDAERDVVFAAQRLDPSLNPKDKDFLIKLINKIDGLLTGREKILDTSQLDVVKIRELVEDYERHLRDLREREEKAVFRAYDPSVKKTIETLRQKYLQELQASEEILAHNEKLAAVISEEVTLETTFNQPQLAPTAVFKKEDYQTALELLKPKIEKSFRLLGLENPKATAENFVKKIAKDVPSEIPVLAVIPRSFTREVLPAPRREFTPEKLILSEEKAAKLAEEKGVASVAAYTVLYPRAAAGYVKRLPYVVPTRIIKMAEVEDPEWQEMIKKGIFAEDIKATLKRLREIGLTEEDPIVQSLMDRLARRLEAQKIKIIHRDGTYFFRDRPAVSILKGFYDHLKRTDQWSAFDSRYRLFYQPSPASYWSAQRGYPWRLRLGLNRVGLATRTATKVEVAPGQFVIRPFLSRAIRTVYRKTAGRAVSFAARKLAQTAIGEAIKSGTIKAATWFAGQLGVEVGAAAIGTATGPVGTAIGFVVGFVIDKAKRVITWIWDKVKTIIRDPEKSLVALIGGITFAAFFSSSIPLVIIGVGASVIGGLGAISWGAASAGAIAGGFAANVVAFFTAVATLPITLPIAMFIIVLLIILAVTTTFIVFTTAGAFILPVGPTEIIEEVPPPPAPPVVPPPPGLTFRWPVDSPFYCSSNYGYRELTISGRKTCDYHEGIDIPASTGASVYSTAEGEVTSLGYNSGYGTYVVVKHNGLYSFYAHLLATATYVGAKVDQSSVIGYVDNTGWSTGPHLHFAFSSCGSVPGCFNDGSLTPDPCNYLTEANPACPESCGHRNRATGCPNL